MSDDHDPPSGVSQIQGEVRDSAQLWTPTTLEEWREHERTRTFLRVWSEQNEDERGLRRSVALWVFSLIGLQSTAIFVLTFLNAFGVASVNGDLLKFIFGSLCAEAFGLGFVVAKYLFNEALRKSLNEIFGKLG